VHVGRRPAPGHPRRVSVALALAPEHDAMKGGRLDRLSDWLVALLVAEVVVIAFFPAFRAGFVSWDDDTYFLNNPYYRGLGPAQLRWMFTVTSGHYMPLTWLTHGLDYVLWVMRRGWYWSAVALAALALLSKAMAVTLPLVLLLLDVYPFRRLGPWRWTRRDVWLEKIPFFVLSAAAAVMAIVAQRSVGTLSDLRALGVFERLGLAAYGLVFYADKTL